MAKADDAVLASNNDESLDTLAKFRHTMKGGDYNNVRNDSGARLKNGIRAGRFLSRMLFPRFSVGRR